MVGLHFVDELRSLPGIFHGQGLAAKADEDNAPQVDARISEPQSRLQHFRPGYALVGGFQQRFHAGFDAKICPSQPRLVEDFQLLRGFAQGASGAGIGGNQPAVGEILLDLPDDLQ